MANKPNNSNNDNNDNNNDNNNNKRSNYEPNEGIYYSLNTIMR
jgi:hypothetical protein